MSLSRPVVGPEMAQALILNSQFATKLDLLGFNSIKTAPKLSSAPVKTTLKTNEVKDVLKYVR